MATRCLIVNADDLGMTAAVNKGIFAAHEEGIVTSASLMVGREAAADAAEAVVAHPDLAVGLHLEPEGCCWAGTRRTEIGCHPAAGPVSSSSYDTERRIELATLRDPGVKTLLNVTSVRLCSYAQVFAPKRATFEA